MGKIWDLAQLERRTGGSVFDLAIVDAPATGHGLALLRAPATFARIARTGPIARQARLIDEFTRDPATTAIIAAALPEEMPVTETLELEDRLAEDNLALDAIVVNALYPERFDAEEADSLASLDGRGSEAARAALRRGPLRAPAGTRPARDGRAAARGGGRAGSDPAAPVRPGAGARRARHPLRAARGRPVIESWLARKEICICAGSGGVGKTTTSAAIALGMAARGKKVAVPRSTPPSGSRARSACRSWATRSAGSRRAWTASSGP